MTAKGVWTGNNVSAITFRKMCSNCSNDLIGIISGLKIECSRRPGIQLSTTFHVVDLGQERQQTVEMCEAHKLLLFLVKYANL